MSPDDPRHGTYAGYHQHVRHDHGHACQPCLDAAARYERGRQLDLLSNRPRITSTLAATRRIQALVALGYTYADLSDRLGSPATSMGRLAKRPAPGWMTIAFADQIEALYDQLSMRLPATDTRQQQRRAAYARTVAHRNGWAVPLAWEGLDLNDPDAVAHTGTDRPHTDDVDEVAVLRALDGQPPAHLTRAERFAIVIAARQLGLSLKQITALTGITKPERYTTTAPTTLTRKEHTAA